MSFFRKAKKLIKGDSVRPFGWEIDPDEVLLDSKNLPQFDTDQFEGRIVKPISVYSFILLAFIFVAAASIFGFKAWRLQVREGEAYAERSENNRLHHTIIFANRGVIFDRNGVMLAWNDPNPDNPDFPLRSYADMPGLAHVLGYVKPPSKDKYGFYYREDYVGHDGIEMRYNDLLSGKNGLKIKETDALGKMQSESQIKKPENGANISLSVDSALQSKLYSSIVSLSDRVGFAGGAGAIMDVETGEIVALTSYPEYDPEIVSRGENSSVISSYLTSTKKPFLNRASGGVYTPGSIVKPYVAIGALSENIISPDKIIVSEGSISLPNPYYPNLKSVFTDWKAHGPMDMRRALAVSSNVYFYIVGGGFKDQKGLGISNIEKYVRLFGLGSPTGIDLPGEKQGTIPNPAWKEKVFNGESWKIGDTYHTSIGQYGFQVTLVQMLRAVAAIANGGTLVTPHLLRDSSVDYPKTETGVPDSILKIVREGLRQGATEGTAKNLNVSFVEVAAKTGTAELGVSKEEVNSWATGFFPYRNPKYAFAIMMEKGSRHNTVGSVFVMREVLDWMKVYAPQYLE